MSGFLEDNIEIDVLCGLPNYPKGEWFEGYTYTGPRRESYQGAEIFRCGEVPRKGNTSIRIFLNYVSFPFFALFNLPRLAGRKYDAVFCYETSPVMMIFPALVYAKIHRIPLTTYVLDLWPDNLYSVLPLRNKLLRGIAQGVSNWHYRHCTRLIAMSDLLAEKLKEVSSRRKRSPEITVIPQYCEDFYAQDIRDENLTKQYAGHFNILFAGNFSPAQDLENLIDALAIAREQDEKATNIRILLLGDGMSKESLRQHIARKELQDVVLFCGSIPAEDIPRWTGFADVLFAGLAKSENLGLTVPAKITSYFAAGKPILVAADGEAARVSVESDAALVSAAGDSNSLAQNILTLFHSSKDELALMGENGRKCYTNYYRREPLLRRLREFILQEERTP